MYLYIRNINSEKEKGNDNNDDNERKFQRILFPLENNEKKKGKVESEKVLRWRVPPDTGRQVESGGKAHDRSLG